MFFVYVASRVERSKAARQWTRIEIFFHRFSAHLMGFAKDIVQLLSARFPVSSYYIRRSRRISADV